MTSSLATNIGSQTSTSKVEGVNKSKRSGTSSTTRGQISSKELPEILLGIVADENLLVLVLEGKVQGLGGEVADDVGQVTAPQRRNSLFGGNATEGVKDALVALVLRYLSGSVLGLKNQLDTLDGRHDGFTNTTSQTTGHQVQKEGSDRITALRLFSSSNSGCRSRHANESKRKNERNKRLELSAITRLALPSNG